MRNYKRGSEWRRWDLHLHTASSYDYSYKGVDANELLCNTLKENNIGAVAITDHFKIDKKRIEDLRKLAPEITFFPGVELRTDKGANNLHIIIIFSDNCDLANLESKFNVIMLGEKAKSKENNDKIYWDFNDIISFTNDNDGLLSIHAGKKTNGLEREISNTLPVKEAIKEEISNNIHFFEVGQKKDIIDYKKHVIPLVGIKPIIICSDNHNPKEYHVKEKLWIKANPTFEGLKQCLYQPDERVFVGEKPPLIERENSNKRLNIKSIKTIQVDKPKNTTMKWFDFELPLNSGLVAIIGNKGSGKSALADIIGNICESNNIEYASFLHENRFRKKSTKYDQDYNSIITWKDNHEVKKLLSDKKPDNNIENAQYLPQKYIEEICNDIDNKFQDEIDKVIFSYVDEIERGDSKNLKELIDSKSEAINLNLKQYIDEMKEVNKNIILLEHKKTPTYKTEIEDKLKKLEEDLKRCESNEPIEVMKPPSDGDDEYNNKLQLLNNTITKYDNEIKVISENIKIINKNISSSETILTEINKFNIDLNNLSKKLNTFSNETGLNNISIVVETPENNINDYLDKLNTNREELYKKLEVNKLNLDEKNKEKEEFISKASFPNKKYEEYLIELKKWENNKLDILGNENTDNTIKYFEQELNFINKDLNNQYDNLSLKRNELCFKIFKEKENKVEIYNKIYEPIKSKIQDILGNLEETIVFNTEIQLINNNLATDLLSFISQKHSGLFRGKIESQNTMNKFIKETEFNNKDSLFNFIQKIYKVITEDFDTAEQKVGDKQSFYNKLFELEYIDVIYKLKLGDSHLEELSPGERGIVLLVFYLALSKENMPIIIDQPEDNLDNQSVFDKLVPCICEAKNKRQVIIVTHNPNIAIACDAEQIIYCSMDKTTKQIKYIPGAIEDEIMRNHVIDVLEGTMPAFDLRKRKYLP